MHSVFSLLIVTFTALAAGSFAPTERDVIKKEYAVSPGGTLHLDLDRGNIEVEVTEKARVFIEMERIAKAKEKEEAKSILEHHEYAFERRHNDVYVRSRYDADRFAWNLRKRPSLKINVVVRVPSEYNVVFSNGAGNVEVFDVVGDVRGTTGAGNVTLENIEGRVEVSSGAGNLEVSGAIGAAEVNTGAGNIALYDLQGTVQAGTGAGNIDAVIVHQPEGHSRFGSGAGNVTVALSDDIGVFVRATANIGSAKCEFPLTVSKKLLSKSFSGEINGGGAELELHAAVGNVVLKRHRTR